MDNRDDLERKIEECFEKMPVEKKIDFLAQVDEMEAEEISNVSDIETVRDRIIYDVERFGRPPIVFEDFEIVGFLFSMSFIILEITRELLKKTKGRDEIQIDDIRKVMSSNDEFCAKIMSETAVFLSNLFEIEFGDDMPHDERWCLPYPLIKWFNAVKSCTHLGEDYLIDISIFKE